MVVVLTTSEIAVKISSKVTRPARISDSTNLLSLVNKNCRFNCSHRSNAAVTTLTAIETRITFVQFNHVHQKKDYLHFETNPWQPSFPKQLRKEELPNIRRPRDFLCSPKYSLRSSTKPNIATSKSSATIHPKAASEKGAPKSPGILAISFTIRNSLYRSNIKTTIVTSAADVTSAWATIARQNQQMRGLSK